MKNINTEDFLNICISLTGERDREKLLSDILDSAMAFNNCDAGTLYLCSGAGLEFCRMVTISRGLRQGGHADPISLPPVPYDDKYVSAYAVNHKETVYVDHVRNDDRFDFEGSKRYDEMTGYYTGTMCVIPITNDKGVNIGALQLINSLDDEGNICAFDRHIGLMTAALASLIAICITNMQYATQIEDLLNSLVRAMSTAIDERTPYNANHTRNMVRYADSFLEWLENTNNPMAYDAEKRKAFVMSVWLHDVGKLVVPLEVMDKPSRLGSKLELVLARLRTIGLLSRISELEGRMTKDEAESFRRDVKDTEEFVLRINNAGFLPDQDLAKVQELASYKYADENGEMQSWFTEDEIKALSVRRGTLTDDERKIMESHVSATARILSGVAFPESYGMTPIWAAEHHELLNGKGYPDHLSAKDIPEEVRLLTILDVFDALTARDRPYKPPVPVDKALAILHSMADEGGLDKDILRLFEESKAWEAVK
ncbi:MAG: GAF domain-containing protein [Firmicutes bacterium]|nr:GAF domain-containing protein [Bacillota bacterium]